MVFAKHYSSECYKLSPHVVTGWWDTILQGASLQRLRQLIIRAHCQRQHNKFMRYTYAYADTHAHAYTDTNPNAYDYPHADANANANAYTYAYAHAYTDTNANADAYT